MEQEFSCKLQVKLVCKWRNCAWERAIRKKVVWKQQKSCMVSTLMLDCGADQVENILSKLELCTNSNPLFTSANVEKRSGIKSNG